MSNLVKDLADTLRAVTMLAETGYPLDPILPDVKAVLERALVEQNVAETRDRNQWQERARQAPAQGAALLVREPKPTWWERVATFCVLVAEAMMGRWP